MKHWVKRLFLSFLIGILLEVTIFQYQFYATARLEKCTNYSFSTDHMAEKENEIYTLSKQEDGVITLVFFEPTKVDTLNFQYMYPMGDDFFQKLKLKIELFDEGNSEGYTLPERTIVSGISESGYLRLHPAGLVNKIQITFTDVGQQTEILLRSLQVNVPIPFTFYVFRVVLVAIFLFAFWSFRAKGGWKQETLSLNEYWKKPCVSLIVIILIFLFSIGILFSSMSAYPKNARMYISLTEALTEGRVDVDVPYPDSLLDMENPYDVTAREGVTTSTCWDYAFLDGKFYVYFGIAPVILYYMPVYLMFGSFPPIYLEFFLSIMIFVVGCFLLVYEVLKRYFPKTNYWIYILLAMGFTCGCGYFYLAAHPDFYSMAIMTAINSTIYMMYFYLTTVREDGLVRKYKLVLGGICTGLIAGSRPQMLLGWIILIPFLIPLLFAKGISRGERIKRFLALGIPILFFACGLMYYNYARFGSVLDFGANYNLTTNDMTKRGFVFDRLGLGIFTFLFETPRQTTEFPFIKAVDVNPLYQGRTIKEAMQGGVFFLVPGILISYTVGIRAAYSKLREKKLFSFVVASALVGIIIAGVDSEVAGILARYQGDMAVFFSLGSVVILAALWELLQEKHWSHTVARGLLTLVVITIFTGCMQMICCSSSIQKSQVFYILEQIFCFWL